MAGVIDYGDISPVWELEPDPDSTAGMYRPATPELREALELIKAASADDPIAAKSFQLGMRMIRMGSRKGAQDFFCGEVLPRLPDETRRKVAELGVCMGVESDHYPATKGAGAPRRRW